jgi:hypothetical protein
MHRPRLHTPLLSVLIVLLVGLAHAGLAAAQAPVRGEVIVVLAKEEAGTIDKQLESVKALKKPPFNGFKSMKVLATHGVKLTDNGDATVSLPNGRTLQLKLLERMPDGRHKVQVAINKKGKKDYLPLLTVIASDEPFFVAGQKFEGGTLVIGVRVGLPAKKTPTK